MNTEWVSLDHVAAQTLARGTGEDGITKLEEIAKKARKEILWRAVPLLSVSFFSMMFLAILGVMGLQGGSDHQYDPKDIQIIEFYYAVPSVVLLLASASLIWLLQHQEPFVSWCRLSKSCYPAELEPLFKDLQSGKLEAKNKRGRLPRHLFDSSWRILLAAGPNFKQHLWLVRDKGYRAYEGDIEIKRAALDQADDLAPLPPFQVRDEAKPPQRDKRSSSHWIAEIPESQFEAFLDAVEKRRKWEHESAPKKVRIALIAARKFAMDQHKNGAKVTITKMVEACEEAIRRELGSDTDAFTGLSGKGKEKLAHKNSAFWIELMLRNEGQTPYSWVRELAKELTARKVTEQILK